MRITFVGNFDVDYTSETHHANTLESMGHTVRRLREGKTNKDEILSEPMNLLVWVHTHGWRTDGQEEIFKICKERGIKSLTYHLDLWLGLKREKDLDIDPFYRDIELFFTVDKLMADWFNKETEVKGIYLPPAVYDKECYISGLMTKEQHDVIFVGSKGYHPEWPYRPKLIDWLRQTYGSRFTHVGGDGDTGTVRGDQLNRLYANSKVAIGDTLCLGFDYPYYYSDRLFEAPGRGAFQIFPRIKGIEDIFTDGENIVLYDFNNFDQLKGLIDKYLNNHQERERIRANGHNHVKENHTYRNRWEFILDEISKN